MKRIGAYEVHEVVGRGGMGAVFRAKAPDGRVVALKLLLRTVSSNLERFERERRILERLGEEEGFVSFLDAGTAPDGAFLVMGFAEGGSLRGRLGRERFTIAEAIALGTKLARAIGRAHELGIVHRDLKPENILFDANGGPLVADLGLAKHFRADVTGASQSVSLSQAGELRGTAGYMAREQMLDARSADASADVFALGAILYECLAGEPAFVGATVIELVSLIEKGEVAPLRTRRADVPRWLDDAVLRALSPERADRFPDGHAFAAALEAGGKRRRSPLRRALPLLAGVALAGTAASIAIVVPAVASARRASPTPRPPLAPRPPAPPPAPAGGALHVERAHALWAQNDREGAWTEVERAIKVDPKHSQAWHLRGNYRMRWKNDFPGAFDDFTRAVELDEKNAVAWCDRGQILEARGEHVAAIADLTKAIDLSKRDDAVKATAHYTRANARAATNDNAGALEDYTEGLRIEPSLKAGWKNRAITRIDLGDTEGAESDATRALALDKEDYTLHGIRATARHRLGNHAGAIADYDAAEKFPSAAGDLPRIWRTRAGIKTEQGDTAGAIADYEKFLERFPGHADAPTVRTKLEQLRGR